MAKNSGRPGVAFINGHRIVSIRRVSVQYNLPRDPSLGSYRVVAEAPTGQRFDVYVDEQRAQELRRLPRSPRFLRTRP